MEYKLIQTLTMYFASNRDESKYLLIVFKQYKLVKGPRPLLPNVPRLMKYTGGQKNRVSKL